MCQTPASPTRSARLKDSIRDLVRLQQIYDPSDELLWAFFNARVLMNQAIAVDDFVQQAYTSTLPLGQHSSYAA